jgi:hypothetical protein
MLAMRFSLRIRSRWCNALVQKPSNSRTSGAATTSSKAGTGGPVMIRPMAVLTMSAKRKQHPNVWHMVHIFHHSPLTVRVPTQTTIAADGDQFIMRADNWSMVDASARGRNSVRISSQTAYPKGIIVLDADHMPEGCATWPAFWTTSKGSWPDGGEIDITEGTHPPVSLYPPLSNHSHA